MNNQKDKTVIIKNGFISDKYTNDKYDFRKDIKSSSTYSLTNEIKKRQEKEWQKASPFNSTLKHTK